MVGLGVVDSRRDIHLRLPDNVGPFAVQFAIVKKGTNQMPRIPPEQDLPGGCIMCSYEDKEFGLLLAMTKVMKTRGLAEVAWPPFPVVLKRVG